MPVPPKKPSARSKPKTPSRTSRDRDAGVSQNSSSDVSQSDPLRLALQSVIDSVTTNAAARTAAIRTLAEMDGLLGRHQRAPGAELERAPLSDASRSELETELARLRLHFAAQGKANNARGSGT